MEFGLIEILSSYPIHFTIHSDKFIILFLSRWKSKQYQYLLFRFILISLSLSLSRLFLQFLQSCSILTLSSINLEKKKKKQRHTRNVTNTFIHFTLSINFPLDQLIYRWTKQYFYDTFHVPFNSHNTIFQTQSEN